MIVDCHTHLWETPAQLGPGSDRYLRRQVGTPNLSAKAEDHLAASDCADKVFVLGFISRFLGAGVPNRLVAEHVNKHPHKMIGLAGIDPTAEDVDERLAEIAETPAFRGVTISPAGQNFHPADTRMDRFYGFCAEHKLVVLAHQGTHFWAGAKMEFARPYLWDEVLREHPQLKLIIAHLGHPWIDETLALLGKQPGAFADIAGLIRRPWHAYNSLAMADQFAVGDKLLFGSDFPFLTASEAIESLYRLNEFTHGTMLPSIPREMLRSIIERNALEALGIERPGDRENPEKLDEDQLDTPEEL